MNRSIAPLACFCILLTVGDRAHSAPLDPLAALAQDFAERAGSRALRIAVLDFHYPDRKPGPSSIPVQDGLTTHLVRTGRFDVVERLHLARILEEQSLERTGLVDPKTTKTLGRLLGVEAVVVGSLNPSGPTSVDLNARIVEVDSGRILAAGMARYTQGGLAFDPPGPRSRPLVQIALLLDTSSSMDGLIHQARTRLWQVVNDLASAERNGQTPIIEVALYEYGNNGLSKEQGYIRQVIAFTTDLDRVSERLFSLHTQGGHEFCGKVIRDAVSDLRWHPNPDTYKTIFIAGNEPFTQGPVPFRSSVAAAREKGIYVNTIYCGSASSGRATGWAEGAAAGGGDYLSINQNERHDPITAPQDPEIGKLGRDINDTFIPYGPRASVAVATQSRADRRAEAEASSGAAAERALYKGKRQYAQASWDLVTSIEQGRLKVADIKRENLPESLKKLSRSELERLIAAKLEKRKQIRARLAVLEKERRAYLDSSRRAAGAKSVDAVMRTSIRKQAAQKSFEFK